MILHRSPRGVVSTDYSRIILRPLPTGLVQRVERDDFHAGALDASIVEAFDLIVLVEALARDMAAVRGISFTDPTSVPPGRSRIARLWIGDPDNPRQIWIRGRVVAARVAGAEYEASLDVHLANGFPKAITDAFTPEVIEMVRVRVAALAPLPCFCHTGTEYIEEHDTLEPLVSRSDPKEPHVSVTVGRCKVCNTGWTFGRNSERRLGDGAAVRPFAPIVDFVGDEADRIIAGVRGGAEVEIGDPRCHTTYRGKNGALVSEYFDEGHTQETPIDEPTLRAVVDGHREDFLDVLRRPLKERLRVALLEGATLDAARTTLAELLAYGDCLNSTDLFEAVLAWPDGKPTPDEVATLTKEKTGNDLFHSIMSGIGYGTKSAAGGRFGLRFFETVAEMLGHETMRDFRRYRAHFRAMAGDLHGALGDLEWEKSQLTKDDEYLDREIDDVRKRIEADAQRPKRTLTVLVVSAEDPDELDAMSYAQRREDGLGWTRIELLHPGEPDVLVRLALDLDMGVYGAAREWDADAHCIEETSCIFYSDLEERAALLAPHVAEPNVLAARLVDHAQSGEDPKRVARALVEKMTEPAGGPAEEAATYVRVFFEHLPYALKFLMGIAWELRTPAPCGCAAWDGRTLGNITAFPRSQFETLAGATESSGRLRCVKCDSTFSFVSTGTYATLTREPPAPPPPPPAAPLPALPAFAEEVGRIVGGTVVALGLGPSPAASIRIGAHCVLLIRERDGGFALSLPLAGSWVVSSTSDFRGRAGRHHERATRTPAGRLAERRHRVSVANMGDRLLLGEARSARGLAPPRRSADSALPERRLCHDRRLDAPARSREALLARRARPVDRREARRGSMNRRGFGRLSRRPSPRRSPRPGPRPSSRRTPRPPRRRRRLRRTRSQRGTSFRRRRS